MQQKKTNVNYYFQDRLTFKIKTDLDATVDSHKNTGIIYSDDRVSKCESCSCLHDKAFDLETRET